MSLESSHTAGCANWACVFCRDAPLDPRRCVDHLDCCTGTDGSAACGCPCRDCEVGSHQLCARGCTGPPQNAIEEVQAQMKRKTGADHYLDMVTEKAAARAREATISPEEHATILAALTYWRQCRLTDAENRPPVIQQIATNGGTLPHVTEEKVKLLLDRLNGAEVIKVQPHDTRPLGTKCAVCGEPQYATPSGALCKNGHGGARALAPGEEPGGVVPSWAFSDVIRKVPMSCPKCGPYVEMTARSDGTWRCGNGHVGGEIPSA